MPELPPRIPLALLPTPLEPAPRLSAAWGGPRLWAKRDDLAGFGLSGNKVRKLEFHLAAARAAGADTLITCGAVQSNHSRATALAAARVGLRTVLLLRRKQTDVPRLEGNLLLDALAGARIRFITAEQWPHRDELMAEEAASQLAAGHPCWVIPEGASDALGMWGFVLAMRELATQMSRIEGPPAVLWHAASSGGTTAGIGWAVDRLQLENPIVACSVGDPASGIEAKVQSIWSEAASSLDATVPAVSIEYNDKHVGGGYGIVTDDDLAVQAEVTGLTGMILDPTYTGKAITGLKREIAAGRFSEGDNVVFWHTGGGFAVFTHDFSRTVSVGDPAGPLV